MFLACTKQLLKRVPKCIPRTPTIRFRFSEQNKNQDGENSEADETIPPQKPGFFSTTVFLGIGVLGLIGYGAFQEYTKKQQNPTQGGKFDATAPIVELSTGLKSALESYGKNSLEYATALREEGRKLYIDGESEKSMELLQQSFDIVKKLKGSESDEVALVYREIGQNFFNQGKIEEAQKYLQKASEIHSALGKFDQAFDELETVALGHAKDFVRGKELFEKIIEQRKEKVGPADPFLARTYIRLAMLYSTQRRKEEVLENLQKAFNLMKSNKIPKESLSNVYQELSLVYHNIQAFNEALNATQKAIQNLDPVKEAAKIRQLTKQTGAIHSLLKNPTKSIEIYKNYAEDMKKIEGANKFDLADTYRRIATEYEKMNDIPAAIENWGQFVDIFRGTEKKELAISAKMKSCALYFKIKKADKGIDCFEDCFMWASRDLGDEHKLTNDAFEILQTYKQKQ